MSNIQQLAKRARILSTSCQDLSPMMLIRVGECLDFLAGATDSEARVSLAATFRLYEKSEKLAVETLYFLAHATQASGPVPVKEQYKTLRELCA